MPLVIAPGAVLPAVASTTLQAAERALHSRVAGVHARQHAQHRLQVLRVAEYLHMQVQR